MAGGKAPISTQRRKRQVGEIDDKSCCHLFGPLFHALMSHSTGYIQPSSSTSTRARGRGYSRSRRGIRARVRGYQCGLPARNQERLTPDGEQSEQLDEAEAEELEARYARRTIGTNADRYEEPEPEIGPDGMNSIEPRIVNIM